MDSAIKLIIFDLDGTLAPFDSDQLFTDAAQWIAENQHIPWLIATNQGGIGLRYWMERDGFGDPSKYPTLPDFEARVKKLFGEKLPTILVCLCYQSKKSGQWGPIPRDADIYQKWNQHWRKPAPGMVLETIKVAGCSADEVLVVGDGEEDRQAATNAGCKFQWAWEFFGRPAPIAE